MRIHFKPLSRLIALISIITLVAVFLPQTKVSAAGISWSNQSDWAGWTQSNTSSSTIPGSLALGGTFTGNQIGTTGYLNTNGVKTTISPGGSQPGTAWDPSSGLAYVFGDGNSSNAIYTFNPSTKISTTLSATLPSGYVPTEAFWDSTRSKVYLFARPSGTTQQIYQFDPSTGSVSLLINITLPISASTVDVAWDPTNTIGYIFFDNNNVIFKFDPSLGTAVNTGEHLSPITSLTNLAFWDTANSKAYVINSTSVYEYTPGAGDAILSSGILSPVITDRAVVWNSINNKVYLYGGLVNTSTAISSIYTYDPATKQEVLLSEALPNPVDQAASFFDATAQKTYILEGIVNGLYSNQIMVHSLSGGGISTSTYLTNSGTNVTLPYNTLSTALAWDPSTGIAYLFGNGLGSQSIATFNVSTKTISTSAVQLPSGYTPTRAVWDTARHKAYLFSSSTTTTQSIYQFDPAAGTVSLFATFTLPSVSNQTSVAWNSGNQIGYLFFSAKNLIYKFDASLGTVVDTGDQLAVNLNIKKSNAAFWDTANSKAYVVGVTSVQEYTPGGGNATSANALSPTTNERMLIWDPINNKAYFYGGVDVHNTPITTISEYDPANKTQVIRNETLPDAAYYSSIFFNPVTETTYLLGGMINGNYSNQIINHQVEGTRSFSSAGSASTIYDNGSSTSWGTLTRSQILNGGTLGYYAKPASSVSCPTSGGSWTGWSSLSFTNDIASLSGLSASRYLCLGTAFTTSNSTQSPQVQSLALNTAGGGGGNNPPTVSTLGPTSLTDGSRIYTNTPGPFTFTTADSNGDQVSYHIQISSNSDYSNPALDYTSGLSGTGTTSFTLGQTAGSGSYTIGSASTTLSDASYYWRVMVTDAPGASSSYSTASSGSPAFVVDTSVPATPTITPPANTGHFNTTTPTLTSSAYSGTGSQTASQWQISTSSSNFSNPLQDTHDSATDLTSHTFTSLSDGTYYAQVRYKSAGGYSAYSAVVTVIVDTAAPTFSGISAISNNSTSTNFGANGNTVTLTFTTSEPLRNNPTVTIGSSIMTMQDLTGSTYTYTRILDGSETEGSATISIAGTDLAGNLRTDTSLSFTTDFTAPTISAVSNGTPGQTSATVTWTTNENASSQVQYGTTLGLGITTAITNAFPSGVTSHSATVSSLTCGTVYYFKVTSVDHAGNVNNSSTASFTTQSCPSAPAVSTLGPTGLTNGSHTSNVTPGPFTFTTSDPQGQQVRYRIQITNNSDFSSPVIDYTSSLALAGNASFTVGQVAGSGSYTTGSASTTLADSYYYWRVLDTNTTPLSSGWLVANSGLPAFYVDHTGPATPTLTSPAAGAHLATATLTLVGSTYTDASAQGSAQWQVSSVSNFASTVVDSGVDTTHLSSYTTSSLSDGTYYARVRYTDSIGNTSSYSPAVSFSIDTAVPTFSSISTTSNNSVSTSIGANGDQVTITFITSEALSANPSVKLGTKPVSFVSLSGNFYTYRRTLDGSETNGSATISITGSDLAGNAGSASSSFTTDFTPPTLSSISSNTLSTTSATITWTTNKSASSQVAYGTSSSLGTSTAITDIFPSLVTSHSVTLPSLTCGTIYFFAVTSRDRAGNSTTSSINSFTTPTCPSAPAVSTLGPLNLVNGNHTAAITPGAFTFTTSDPQGEQVSFHIQITTHSDFSLPVIDYISAPAPAGSGSFMVGQVDGSGSSYATGSASTTLADGAYYWRVQATNTEPLNSSWVLANGGAPAFVVDNTAPSTPSLTAPINGSTIASATPTLVSSPYSDASSQASSQWQVSFVSNFSSTVVDSGVDTTHLNSYTTSSLTDGLYYARIRYRDSLGNTSSYSPAVSFTIDTTAPTPPTNLAVMTPQEIGSLDISWTASVSSDIAYLTLYRSTDSSLQGTAVATSLLPSVITYHDTGLVSSTQYYYVLISTDLAGNNSLISNQASGITLVGPSFLLLALPGQAFINGIGITGAPDPTTAGTSLIARLYAVTSGNSVVSLAHPSITLASNDTQAVLPSTTLSSGTGSVTIILKTAGTITLSGSTTGLPIAHQTILISPSSASSTTSSLVANANTATVGTAITYSLTLKDSFSNPIPSSTVSFNSSRSTDVLTQNSPTTNGQGLLTGSLTATTTGTTTLTASVSTLTIVNIQISFTDSIHPGTTTASPSTGSSTTPTKGTSSAGTSTSTTSTSNPAATSSAGTLSVRLTAPSIVAVSQAFSLSASSLDTNTPTFLWSFPDGTFATQASPTYIFQKEGNYNVTVALTTKDGSTGTATAHILVARTRPTLTDVHTSGNSILVAGTAPAGSTVLIVAFSDPTSFVTTATQSSTFFYTIDGDALPAGGHTVTAIALNPDDATTGAISIITNDLKTAYSVSHELAAAAYSAPVIHLTLTKQVASTTSPATLISNSTGSRKGWWLWGVLGAVFIFALGGVALWRKRR